MAINVAANSAEVLPTALPDTSAANQATDLHAVKDTPPSVDDIKAFLDDNGIRRLTKMVVIKVVKAAIDSPDFITTERVDKFKAWLGDKEIPEPVQEQLFRHFVGLVGQADELTSGEKIRLTAELGRFADMIGEQSPGVLQAKLR